MRQKIRTNITTRVVALTATAAILVGTTLVLLIVAVAVQREAAQTAFRSQEALTAGSQLENSLNTIESGPRAYIASADRAWLTPAIRALERYPQELRALVRLFDDEAAERRQAIAIGRRIDDYVAFWARPLIELAELDRGRAASAVLSDRGEEQIAAIRRDLAGLFERERAVTREREERAEERSASAVRFGIGGLALVGIVAIGFGLYLRRSFVAPVLTVADATGRVAAGELSTRVPVQREDELGDLARSFNSMADSLERGRDELERSNAELSRSNAELEQFASVTSHDLQAPLTTISMYTELLERRRGAPDGSPDLVEGIREATGQARTLIRDLLDYSRAGRGQIALEEIPAGAIVEQALETLAGAIEDSGAQVTVGELPTVRADRASLVRVFTNLVGNAVKFAGEDTPRVSIDAQRDGDEWRFCVRDNGIGMDPAHARRIFEPFQRLHGEEDYPGTGIGLAVCERIVDQHGGRIWVESAPGDGSTFSFTLPATAAAPPAAPATTPRVRTGA